MKAKALLLLMVVALMGAVVAAPMRAEAAAPQLNSISIPLTGTLPGGAGNFVGTFDVTRFTTQNGALAATGTLTGTLTDALGNLIGTVSQTLTLPIGASATCQILHLVLGPLDLTLLGLNVHLNQVVLDITAQSGPGNLVGNLLCAVANLLNNGGPLSSLTNLLNNLLRNL